MQIQFKSIAENSLAAAKWKNVFDTFWPGYDKWLFRAGFDNFNDLNTCQHAILNYMPEMMPTYYHLCNLVNADERMAKFLTGFQPPPYINGCAQAVITNDEIQLIRNYDYAPQLLEGVILMTNWNGKKVMGSTDCLSGLLDGMNEHGLAISITFGGRRKVGIGFGISFILRYILEFCTTIDEAVAALIRIPTHMSYNITMVDKNGQYQTVMVAPDKEAVVSDAAYSTNHQSRIDWKENALFNKTVQRAAFLKKLLRNKHTAAKVTDAFLKAPLYNALFRESFGTLYTAIYKPQTGSMQLRWKGNDLHQSFTNFEEGELLINYKQSSTTRTMKKKIIKNITTYDK